MTLLRASGEQAGLDIDLKAALDPDLAGDAGIPAGADLIRFAVAAHHLDDDLGPAGAAVEDRLGAEARHEAVATVAIFNGLVRVADGTGIQVDAGVLADSADFRPAMGIDDFAGAANTTTVPLAVDRSSVPDLFA